MEEAFEALRDRCSTGKLVIISEWNIELNNKGVYDKTAEADCWLGEDHKYYPQERPYFSSENSLRKTPTSETWGYGSALSNRYSGWGTHVLGKLSDQKGH